MYLMPRNQRAAQPANPSPLQEPMPPGDALGSASIDKLRFFILGCPRSGTTLMRLVLESHSKVFCFDETEGYLALASNSVEVPDGKELVGFKVPLWTEQFKEEYLSDPISGEPVVPRFYRKDPIIFLFRDVRDTVASMLKLGSLRPWLGVPPEIKYKVDHFDWFRTRYARELQQVSASQSGRHAVAAFYWKYKTAAFFEYRAAGWPVLGVRYEDLTRQPRRELSRVVEFLGVDWEESLLDHPSREHGELDSSGLATAFTDPKRQIDTASVGSWEDVITAAHVEEILAIAGDLQEQLYPHDTESSVSSAGSVSGQRIGRSPDGRATARSFTAAAATAPRRDDTEEQAVGKEAVTQEDGLESRIRDYLQAVGERDLPRCMQFYADDATLTLFTPFRGKQSIERWHRDRFAANLQIVRLDAIRAVGDTVTVDLSCSSRNLALLKITSLSGRATIRLAAGKIKEISFGLQPRRAR